MNQEKTEKRDPSQAPWDRKPRNSCCTFAFAFEFLPHLSCQIQVRKLFSNTAEERRRVKSFCRNTPNNSQRRKQKLYPKTEILSLLKTAAAKPPKTIRIQDSFFSLQRKRTDAQFNKPKEVGKHTILDHKATVCCKCYFLKALKQNPKLKSQVMCQNPVC